MTRTPQIHSTHSLWTHIQNKGSYLCIGLDTVPEKLPHKLRRSHTPVYDFNRYLIDATESLALAYKINTAFYEVQGSAGWEALEQTLAYLPKHVFVIADAKRGDIEHTAKTYARTFFETYPFDAITLSPYLGHDSLKPFFAYKDKWSILLGATSNPGFSDLQAQPLAHAADKPLYLHVVEQCLRWATAEQTMFVVGAQRLEALQAIRRLAPAHFLLVPGIGAQGGRLEEVSQHGLQAQGGLLVNASRSILYASEGDDFMHAARKEAQRLQRVMDTCIGKYCFR